MCNKTNLATTAIALQTPSEEIDRLTANAALHIRSGKRGSGGCVYDLSAIKSIQKNI
jgi:hypothetical protein